MKALKIVQIIIALVAVSGASAMVARADIAAGTNDVLVGNANQLYIPLKLSTSGVLTTGGVGDAVDSVSLSGNDSASGYVEFVLTFDLNGVLPGPSDIVDPTSPTTFMFTFEDIDFKPEMFSVGGLDITYRESMALTFLGDPSDTPGPANLTIDDSNYMTFKTDPGPETNKVLTSYEVSLQGDMGVVDFSGINDDKVFALLVKFTSDYTSTGQGSVTLKNTNESHLATLDFSSTVVPEPVSLAVMGLGLVGTAWMRRMRR